MSCDGSAARANVRIGIPATIATTGYSSSATAMLTNEYATM